jgi:hypothetical protein
MKSSLVAAITLILLPSISSSQTDGSVCTALLEHGITNVINYSSEYDYVTVIKDNYCSSSFSSLTKTRQDAFESSIKKLPIKYRGGSTRTQEQHEHFCREYGKLGSGSGQSRYSASSLYDKAIDAWRDCVNLALGGTQIRPSITPDQKFVDFSVSVSRGQAVFTGVDTANMTCQMDGSAVGPSTSVQLSSVAKSLRCERSGTKLQFNSATVQFYPAANVKVKTSTGDYRVDLYEMIDGPAADRIARLEAEIAGLRFALNGVNTDIQKLGQSQDGTEFSAVGPGIGGGQPHTCPPGTFVSMIQASESVAGRYAVDGIKKITFKCTPVVAKPAAPAKK